jgi:glycerol uptake facilitator-like aquaporin
MYPYVIEFLGTALVLSAVAFSGKPIMVIAAYALALALSDNTLGYFNPAITLLNHISGKIGQSKVLFYIFAQLSAAFLVFGLSRVL